MNQNKINLSILFSQHRILIFITICYLIETINFPRHCEWLIDRKSWWRHLKARLSSLSIRLSLARFLDLNYKPKFIASCSVNLFSRFFCTKTPHYYSLHSSLKYFSRFVLYNDRCGVLTNHLSYLVIHIVLGFFSWYQFTALLILVLFMWSLFTCFICDKTPKFISHSRWSSLIDTDVPFLSFIIYILV